MIDISWNTDAPITPGDLLNACWNLHGTQQMAGPHEPHSWTRLIGNTLHPYRRPGLFMQVPDIQVQWPITDLNGFRDEIRRHYIMGAHLTRAEMIFMNIPFT